MRVTEFSNGKKNQKPGAKKRGRPTSDPWRGECDQKKHPDFSLEHLHKDPRRRRRRRRRRGWVGAGSTSKAFFGRRLLISTARTTNIIPSVFLTRSTIIHYSPFSVIRTLGRRRRGDLIGLDVGHPGPPGPSKHTHILSLLHGRVHACVRARSRPDSVT